MYLYEPFILSTNLLFLLLLLLLLLLLYSIFDNGGGGRSGHRLAFLHVVAHVLVDAVLSFSFSFPTCVLFSHFLIAGQHVRSYSIKDIAMLCRPSVGGKFPVFSLATAAGTYSWPSYNDSHTIVK